MSRSVVLEGTERCPRCEFAPRWCICAGYRPVPCPFAVDVLIHRREFHRTTSTGRLVNRLVPTSRGHAYLQDGSLNPATIVRPGRTLWILHPLGEPMPSGIAPADLQVLLLDGSWREAAGMQQTVGRWGRRVSLPMSGKSRYLLRDQQGGDRFSTIEALLFLLDAFGLKEEHAQLRLQFELHVYAGLRARGQKAAAEAFLAGSPLREALPELLEELNRRRPRVQVPA